MEKTADNFGISLLKGILTGVAVCLAGILVFAFILQFVSVSERWIRFTDQIIKLFGITAACLVSVRGEKGYLKGACTGVSVAAVTYILFGLISGSLDFGISVLWEALYGIVAGLLSGIIAVNLKNGL